MQYLKNRMSGFLEKSVINELTNRQRDAQTDWAEFIGRSPWTKSQENPWKTDN